MSLIAALLAASAVLLLALATKPGGTALAQKVSLFDRMVEKRSAELRAARLHVDAVRFTTLCIVTPPAILLIGLVLGSPLLGVAGAALGFLAPRLYLDGLVQAQKRRTEAEAPRLLQILVSSLSGGRTYLESLEEARRRVKDRWLRDDLDYVVTQFHLDMPLETSVK